jgi:hypothetical protein
VNKEIRRLGGCGQKKTPRKIENQQLVSPSRQCSSTPVSFGHGFLSKEQCDNIDIPPYSPDLAPADFHLLPLLKSASKGRHFCGTNDTNENATEELKRLSQNGFQACFQHLYSHWQKCIVAQEEHSEGNVA